VASQPTNVVSGYGSLYTWGQNTSGQIGLNTNINNYSSPVQIGTAPWSALQNPQNGRFSFNLEVRYDSSLWAWGQNTYGMLGLGNGTAYSSPKQVGALTNWLQVAISPSHAVAVKTDGTLWTWGYNGYGNLGLGNTTQYLSPKQVGALTSWRTVAAGGGSTNTHTFAIKTDGTLWAWGYGGNGQLGLQNTTSYSSPKQVGLLTNWLSIAAGDYSALALKTDGTLWAWGYMPYGNGFGNATTYSSPKQIGNLTNWSQASLAAYQAGAIKKDGTLWVWGIAQTYGMLGLGNKTYYSTPVQLGALTTWAQVSMGAQHTLAITTNGSLYAWGRNSEGQLGLGNLTNYSSPKQVGTLNSWHSVSAGGFHSTGLTTNFAPIPAAPTALLASSAGAISVKVNFTTPPATGLFQPTYKVVATPGNISGTGTSLPVIVSGLTNGVVYNFTATATTLAGTSVASTSSNATSATSVISAWGQNNYGQLGLGNVSGYSSPKNVGSLANWSVVSSGNHVMAVKSDGTLWAWGYNVYGQLGTGTRNNYSSPTQVGSLTNWATVSSGSNSHTLAVDTSGKLWAWGNNNYGQLGLGNTTLYSSPVQVGSLTNWKTVTAASSVSYAIKTDGTLWSWGYNGYGQLGDSTATAKSSPVQIGSKFWVQISSNNSHTLGLQKDGTMWAWGYNGQGQLGTGNTTAQSSPIQIGSSFFWQYIAAPYGNTNGHSLAVTTTGALYTWGYNAQGQLGTGNTTSYSSPKQIGLLTNWLNVAGGFYSSQAIKTDGTLWAWGTNAYGQLGTGNTTLYSSPKQIGVLTNWLQISSNYYTSIVTHA
jgi:alpha-tubulin suppressor-like RCC1 family protein